MKKMRLKILLFPAVLVISVIVFIANIWPEISLLSQMNSQYKKDKESLENIQLKKDDVASLNAVLENNKDKKDFVMTYVPEKNNDENNIYFLNYLATNSSLSVLNIGLDKVVEDTSASALEASATNPVNTIASAVVTDPNTGEVIDPQVLLENSKKIKFAKAHVTVAGEYDNIKMYLDKLDRMEVYSKLSEVKIGKNKDDKKEENAPESNLLVADITVEFGYFPKKKDAEYTALAKLGSNFDFGSIDKIRSVVAQNVPGIEAGASGRSNPFVTQ